MDPGFRIDIIGYQPHRYLDRNLKGHSPFDTFFHRIFGVAETVTNKFQKTDAIEIGNRENTFENSLQADVLPLVRLDLKLQKLIIR